MVRPLLLIGWKAPHRGGGILGATVLPAGTHRHRSRPQQVPQRHWMVSAFPLDWSPATRRIPPGDNLLLQIGIAD
jgi:hypothetical protein